MEEAELQSALRTLLDTALVYHAFTDYMRDYELIILVTTDPKTGIQPYYLQYLFKYCVEADVESAVMTEAWPRSLDDRLLANQTVGSDAPGYVWGVKWQELIPAPGWWTARNARVGGRQQSASTSTKSVSKPTRTL